MEENISDRNSVPSTTDKLCKTRYKLLKAIMKQHILENGALCHEIAAVERKVLSAKLERKVLLKRLLQFEKPENKSVRNGQKKRNNSVPGNKDSGTKQASFRTTDLEQDNIKKSKRIKLE